jgi:hypothetical protein
MKMNPTKKKYLNLGVMTVAKAKNPDDKDEAKRFYIKLEQQMSKDGKPYGEQIFPITLANGTVLQSGDMLSMFSKKEKFKKMVEEGRMDQEKADFLSGFLLFDICAVVSQDDDSNDFP